MDESFYERSVFGDDLGSAIHFLNKVQLLFVSGFHAMWEDYFHHIAVVFYLLYIGFSKADVMKLTDTSRTTLWRWMKLFKRPEKSNAPHDQKK